MDHKHLYHTLSQAFPELKIEIELPDIINIETSTDHLLEIEEPLVDLINRNGWYVGFRDIFLQQAYITIHPDQGIEMGSPPPVLYHITAEKYLPSIQEHGLRLDTGHRHGITYSPRIFLTDHPYDGFGVPFEPDERIAIVAVKTWLVPDLIYYRDPEFFDAGWGAASVLDPIPPHALVVPKTGFLRRDLYQAHDQIPRVKIPKRVAVRYWASLAKRSQTPLKTAFFNTAGLLATDAIYKYSKPGWGWAKRLERYFVDGAEQYTPAEHPWRSGAPWWYEHDSLPRGPQPDDMRENPDRLPMPLYTGRRISAKTRIPKLIAALKEFSGSSKQLKITELDSTGIEVATPRSKRSKFTYQILFDSEADYVNELVDGSYRYYITPNYLGSENQDALNAVFRLLFMGDEYVDPFFRKGPKTLTPPQQRAFEGFVESFEAGETAGAVVLPTGVGKTVVASTVISKLYYDYGAIPQRMLFLAGRKEILDQAVSSLKNQNPWITDDMVGQYYGDRLEKRRLLKKKVIFATPHSLRFVDFHDMGRDFFDVIVIDEFHHVNAPIYSAVVDYFEPRYTLGLTATPFRGDDQDPLSKVGDNVLYVEEPWEAERREISSIDRAPTMRLSDAISLGYLVPFNVISLVDTSVYTDRKGEPVELKDLHKYIYPQRDKYIVNAYKKHLKHLQTVVFCKSQTQAKHMSLVFSREGIDNEVLLGADSDRDEKLAAYREKKYTLLIVVDVLNEGVDVPSIEGILYLRPIQSLQIILQQVGRGLRRAPGKRELKIVDLFDNSERLHEFLEQEQIPEGVIQVRETKSSGRIAPPAPKDLLEGGEVTLDIREAKRDVKTVLPRTRSSKLYTFWQDPELTIPFTWDDFTPGHKRGDEQFIFKTAFSARNSAKRMRNAGHTIYVDPELDEPSNKLRRRRKK